MVSLEQTRKNARNLLKELPDNVQMVAAAKTRTPREINAVIDAGVSIIGENYVQETLEVRPEIIRPVKWHFIGHLQKNKVKKIVDHVDLIETVDSFELAEEINKRCSSSGKIMPVFIEINSGKESQKNGIFPEKALELVENISKLNNILVTGVMTMGPFTGDPEKARPYFIETRSIFDALKQADIQNTRIQFLSMGMTNSFKVAIEEGANIIRVGNGIFGDR